MDVSESESESESIDPVQTVFESLLEIRASVNRIQTKLESIETLLDSTLKPTEETQDFFTTLQVKEPTLTDLFYALNTYLVDQGCVDTNLQITPNEYLKTLFTITDQVSYANLLQLLLLKLKIDITRMNLYI